MAGFIFFVGGLIFVLSGISGIDSPDPVSIYSGLFVLVAGLASMYHGSKLLRKGA